MAKTPNAKPKVVDGKQDAEVKKLLGLLATNAEKTERMTEHRNDLGAATKEYLDETGHNKVAVGMIARMHRMSEEKRADVLGTLDKLLPLIRREWMRSATPDMFKGGEKEPVTAEDAAAEMTREDDEDAA